MSESNYPIQVEYKGYKGVSANGRLFTVKDQDDGEFLAVWNLPIANKRECTKALKSALKFLIDMKKIDDIKELTSS